MVAANEIHFGTSDYLRAYRKRSLNILTVTFSLLSLTLFISTKYSNDDDTNSLLRYAMYTCATLAALSFTMRASLQPEACLKIHCVAYCEEIAEITDLANGNKALKIGTRDATLNEIFEHICFYNGEETKFDQAYFESLHLKKYDKALSKPQELWTLVLASNISYELQPAPANETTPLARYA